jgi:hypothetical protein
MSFHSVSLGTIPHIRGNKATGAHYEPSTSQRTVTSRSLRRSLDAIPLLNFFNLISICYLMEGSVIISSFQPARLIWR